MSDMRIIILLICSFITLSLNAQPSPSWFVYPETPESGRFDDIYFVNDSVGWTVNSVATFIKRLMLARYGIFS
jgi:hypothetical protein